MNSPVNHRVIQVRFLTDSTYVLVLERNGLKFVPGQCVNIGLMNSAVNREYSTYSGLKDKNLEFLIKKVVDGNVSVGLSLLNPGDEVSLDGAYGLFTLKDPKKRGQKFLFIASGTGIAPFHSFVRSYPGIDYQILHGIRFIKEQYGHEDYDDDRYIPCTSKEEGGKFYGRVTDYLRSHPIDPTALVYLCGNNAMISDVYDILRNQKISADNIFTEVFF